MAKKDARRSEQPTRRQVARSRKEREQQRLVYMGLGLVAALIVIVLGIDLVRIYFIEPNKTIGTVNGQKITLGEYRDRVYYDRFILDDQLEQIKTELAKLGTVDENDQMGQFVRNQYQQYANQLLQQRSQVDRQAFDNIITDRLVAAEAEKRGLTVTPDEVTETINRLVASRQGGYTEGAIAETSTAQVQATATAALWTPTPTFTPSPTLTSTQSITTEATPQATPTLVPTPTPKILSTAELATEYQNWINTVTEKTDLSEEQYRDYVAQSVLRQKLRDALAEETPHVAEQANVRHILVDTKEEAQAVIDRLNAGEDFGTLAKELSKDPGSADKGGELGFAPRGSFIGPFEEAAFSLPIGQISEPIQTQFGWHVIQVLAREERELSPADYAQMQRGAFDRWLSEARQSAVIEDFWTEDMAPKDPLLDQQS